MNSIPSNARIEMPCQSCSAPNSKLQFFEHFGTPADCGFLPATVGNALACQTGPIQLSVCEWCGLVQNECYDPDIIQFKPGYEVSLEYSPTFRKFQTEVAHRLIEKFELQNKTILEIGCGNGSFLNRLCKLGGNRGIGIDPSVDESNSYENVTFIRDYFSEQHAETKCDFICSLSVFEDIPNLQSTLTNVCDLSRTNEAPFYLEVFNGFRAFEQGEIWSLHYEQCNYFSLASLHNSLISAGFEVTQAGTCYKNDQYLFVDAIAKSLKPGKVIKPDEASLQLLNVFPSTFDNRKTYWENQLSENPEQTIVLWGSGGKGITFLNSIDNSHRVEAVIDINPGRQGNFVPGTGHRIVAPDQLKQIQPDLVVITNAIYRDEISAQLAEMDLHPLIAVA